MDTAVRCGHTTTRRAVRREQAASWERQAHGRPVRCARLVPGHARSPACHKDPTPSTALAYCALHPDPDTDTHTGSFWQHLLGCSHGALPVRGSVEGQGLRPPPGRAARPAGGRRRDGAWRWRWRRLWLRASGRGRSAGGGGTRAGGGAEGFGRAGHAGAADMAEEGAHGRQVPAAQVQRHGPVRRARPAGGRRRPGQSS